VSELLYAMPSLGADMEQGTVLQWFVSPGDEVHRGDVVALIDTEKAEIEAEIWNDGTVAELLVAPGTTVPVGTPLARLTPLGVAAQPALPAVPVPPPPAHPTAPTYSPLVRHDAEDRHLDLGNLVGSGPGGAVTRADVAAARPDDRDGHNGRDGRDPAGAERAIRSSPLARRLAETAGIPLAGLTGSGPGGAVVARDVPRAAPPAPDGRTDTPDRLRRAIGDLMARSKREIPHYYLLSDVDCGPALAWLSAENEARPVARRVLPAALLLKATALAARDVPGLNGHWVDGTLRRSGEVHLGVAISLRGGGLVAPAIHLADRLSLDELMAALVDLVGRAGRGTLRSSEMSDPTITVTNLGDQGVDVVHGVIYPPQVALVGFGRISERPWAVGGLLGVRPVVTAGLAADHRASDGHLGARFLGRIGALLAHPEELR
jgi:pyruvate dehydrogenase E2 component (dihydrolipoamide acetyltransferase)